LQLEDQRELKPDAIVDRVMVVKEKDSAFTLCVLCNNVGMCNVHIMRNVVRVVNIFILFVCCKIK